MMSVWFGLDSNAISNPDVYFEHACEDDWFNDDIVKKMISDIDSSVVESPHCITSPVLGQIPPAYISGGVKALILMYKDDNAYIDLAVCGENCRFWISKLSDIKDFKVSQSSTDLHFDDCGIKAYCENDNTVIENSSEWHYKECKYVYEDDFSRFSSD